MTVGWDAFTVSTWSDRTFVKRFLFENYIQIFQKKNKCLSKQIFIKKKQIDLKISNTA